MKTVNWDLVRARLKEAIFVLPHFLRNPVQGMRQLPDWDWLTIFILQGLFAAACALLANLIEGDWRGLITGPILMPLMNYILLGIFAGFFFYAGMFFFDRQVPYRQVYTHVLFASIPSMVVSIVMAFVPPLLIAGVGSSLLLMFVSLTDHFHFDRIKVKKMLWVIFAVYLIFTVSQIVRMTSRHESLRTKATPESLDILEKELRMEE